MADSTISKGIRILANHGLGELLRRTRATVQRKFGTPEYWRSKFRGARRIRIGNYSVDIGISSFHGDYGEVRFFEENEIGEMVDILNELESSDVFLDVGANIGIHSLFAEKVASKVYSIEPHPTNSSHFLYNTAKNNANIELYQCAFADTEEYIGLVGERGGLDADGSVSLFESNENGDRSPTKIFTRSERGDQFLERYGLQPPTIIKIDVEGAEELVIDGLTNTLQHPECRIVYCEVHEREVAYDTIASKLESFGFDLSVIDDRDYGRTIKARKKQS